MRRSAGIRASSSRTVAVAEPVRPILCSGGSAVRPGRVGRHQEAGDPGPLVGRASHHQVEVGVPAVRRPRLGTVEDVPVAGAAGGGPHRRRVRAGVRLGQAVRPQQVAGRATRAARSRAARRCRSGPAGSSSARARSCRRRRWPRPTRSPPAPAGTPRTAGRRRRLLGVGQAEQPGLAQHPEHLAREPFGRLVAAARGASSRSAISRTSLIRSTASSVGSRRRDVTGTPFAGCGCLANVRTAAGPRRGGGSRR